jgi:autotransporter-associated beta strand protein
MNTCPPIFTSIRLLPAFSALAILLAPWSAAPASAQDSYLYHVDRDETNTLSDTLSYYGWGLTKTGEGVLTLTGANTFMGEVMVEGGTLELASTTGGAAAGVTNAITVQSGAVLLLAESNQVNDTASVTLSGGTIRRGGSVSEVFGALNVASASFLDFGTANPAGHLGFGSYTGSALLTVQGFMHGNTLSFGSGMDLTSTINDPQLFKFEGGFRTLATSFDGNTFTITAMPEPSAYLAVAGLFALFLWPARRRLIKDAKSILGLRPIGRERIEAYRRG